MRQLQHRGRQSCDGRKRFIWLPCRQRRGYILQAAASASTPSATSSTAAANINAAAVA